MRLRHYILLSVVIVILLLFILVQTRPEPIMKDYGKFKEVIKYEKNQNALFKSCMDEGATPETGMITENGLALYCAEKIKDFELLNLFEKLNK